MKFADMLLLVVAVLVPGIKGLLDSAAYWNRARGKAAIIRAKRAAQDVPPDEAPGKRGKRSA
ncbi:hypothetical protein AB0D27_44310 [Streptomyces sp. NPDC048415]|uniref:hypothetical protein n=1 Tax=Streptomyces sp. NPDC048415 TaxID=3154822 RepID=UPI00341AF06F